MPASTAHSERQEILSRALLVQLSLKLSGFAFVMLIRPLYCMELTETLRSVLLTPRLARSYTFLVAYWHCVHWSVLLHRQLCGDPACYNPDVAEVVGRTCGCVCCMPHVMITANA